MEMKPKVFIGSNIQIIPTGRELEPVRSPARNEKNRKDLEISEINLKKQNTFWSPRVGIKKEDLLCQVQSQMHWWRFPY